MQIKELCPSKDKQSPNSKNISFKSRDHMGMKKLETIFIEQYIYIIKLK